jgi:hypothetical protein
MLFKFSGGPALPIQELHPSCCWPVESVVVVHPVNLPNLLHKLPAPHPSDQPHRQAADPHEHCEQTCRSQISLQVTCLAPPLSVPDENSMIRPKMRAGC